VFVGQFVFNNFNGFSDVETPSYRQMLCAAELIFPKKKEITKVTSKSRL